MSEKVYLHLLILCGILSQGIIAILSEENTKESSDVLTRKRRVVTRNRGGSCSTSRLDDVGYVVTIRESNIDICAGVILSRYTVITAARCVPLHQSVYKISAVTATYQLHPLQNVTSKIEHYGNPPYQQFDGIALLTVNPPFFFSRRIRNIPLYTGPLRIGTRVSVYGWECIDQSPPGPPSSAGVRTLCSISLPIMNLKDCENVYRDHTSQHRHLNIQNPFTINRKHICTYDPHQYCARTDAGAPLVVNGMLAGIHVWKGEFESGTNPDVFIDIQLLEYRTWIRENIH